MKLNIIVGLFLTLVYVNQGFGQTVFTVTSEGDGGDINPGNGVCDDGTGNCTLRAAIEEANAIAGKDTIKFGIPGAGVHTIQPSTGLPDIFDSVVIDGYTQPGASPNTNPINLGSNAVLMIEIDGTNAGDFDGLSIISGNSIIRGLVINQFSRDGFYVAIRGGNRIQGNFIGTDVSGTVAQGNGNSGVDIGTSDNIIGGTTAHGHNVISGNMGAGIFITTSNETGNLVQGNYIGTDLTGTVAVGNREGMWVISSNNITAAPLKAHVTSSPGILAKAC